MKTYELAINNTHSLYAIRIDDGNTGSVFAKGIGFLYSTKDARSTMQRLLSEVDSHESAKWVKVA